MATQVQIGSVAGAVVLAALAFVSLRMLGRSWRREWRKAQPSDPPHSSAT